MTAKPTPVDPDEDQESVWDYPRPPRLERCDRTLKVIHAGDVIAETTDGWRVLETSHPPNYYFPPDDVAMEWLRESDAPPTTCEWKGRTRYYDLIVPETSNRNVIEQVAWYYPDPVDQFAELTDAIAFYAHRIDEAWVDGERAEPQPGNFYGGWITSDVVGPFKGEPGTRHW